MIRPGELDAPNVLLANGFGFNAVFFIGVMLSVAGFNSRRRPKTVKKLK